MALERNSAQDTPWVAETAYVHPTATLIGNVVVEGKVFIGPNAVIRADEPADDGTVAPIIVGEEANVQDGVVIHALGGTSVRIGRRSSIAHAAVIHGPCEIGADCFVGFNSVVYMATLGDGVIVMHQSLVEGVTIPAGLHVPSMTGVRGDEDLSKLAPATPDVVAFAKKVCQTNVFLAKAGRS